MSDLSVRLTKAMSFDKLYSERDKLAAAWIKKNEFVNDSLCKQMKCDENEANIFELLGFNVGWSLRGEFDSARLKPFLEVLIECADKLDKVLPAATWFHIGPSGASPEPIDYHNACVAIQKLYELLATKTILDAKEG